MGQVGGQVRRVVGSAGRFGLVDGGVNRTAEFEGRLIVESYGLLG